MAKKPTLGQAQKRVAPVAWDAEEYSRNAHVIRYEVPVNAVSSKWEQWVLLQSDEHWDNPKCLRDLLKEHHDQAIERGACILKFGDTFCAMQGKWDKRSSKDDLRPEHQTANYLDSLVETAAVWYAPYAKNIAVIGLGNHETAIRKHHETDLIDRLTGALRQGGGITRAGGYTGYIRFAFQRGNYRQSIKLRYSHGSGGGGPVTKGAIDFNRIAEYITDADILVAGHVHWSGHTPVQLCELSEANVIHQRERHYLRTATYKDEFNTGIDGFHVEGGRGPRPRGGWWVRFYLKNNLVQYDIIKTEN